MIFIIFGCTNDKYKFDKIKKKSNITFPNKSTIIIFNDDLEHNLTFKVYMDKSQLYNFLKKNQFKKIDTLQINPLTRSNTIKLFIKDVENSFISKEKIYGKNLQILQNKKGVLIVNCDTYELWGLVSN